MKTAATFASLGALAGMSGMSASPAAAEGIERILAIPATGLEKPWALGAKPRSTWQPDGKPTVRAAPSDALIDRNWPAVVQLAPSKSVGRPTLPTPVAYTPYGAPESSGMASYYWQDQMTASGERFDRTAMTAAHRTLPMHTRVRVTRVETGGIVIVRINDRGPFKHGRIIDLSDAAAEALGMKAAGVTEVKLEVIR